MGNKKILSDTWYGDTVNADSVKRSSKTATLLTMMARSFRSDIILTSEGARGGTGLTLLAAFLTVTRQRKLILTEFLPGMQRRGIRGRLTRAGYRLFLDPSLLRAQTMTEWERDAYAKQYRIDPARLVHVQFYTFDDRTPVTPTPVKERSGVFASGKNSTDWATLIEANAGQSWELSLIAKATERPVIEPLKTWSIRTAYDVPRVEHDREMNASQLIVLPLLETSRSAGHVRLMGAATNGVPIIATDVQGIKGYEHLAVKLVKSGDAAALRAAISELLSNPAATEARVQQIREAAKERPFSVYVTEMADFIRG